MKRETLFLKAVVCLMGIPVLALCVFLLPLIAGDASDIFPDRWLYPVLIAMYGSAIPFFAALYQTLKLLGYIDRNEAFSEKSVTALKKIKHCAVAIVVLYAACSPFLFLIGQEDDAPGLPALGLVVMFASAAIAVFAAVLQKLLNHAIELKSENDLTV